MSELHVDFDEVPFLATAHAAGMKKTFFRDSGDGAGLTQFAYGRLAAGETIAEHEHPTMDEYFYFLAGRGEYVVGERTIQLHGGVAVKIPAAHLHALRAFETLDFVYFGIATGEKFP